MQVITAEGWNDNLEQLTQAIVQPPKDNKKVLWHVCGGSNIASSVEVMAAVPVEQTANLTIMLTDERYGEEAHADSNWRQLDEAGFDSKQAITIPTLQDKESLVETVDRYNVQLAKALEANEVIIAQYGIGPDGHIAGILPNSPAADDTDHLVTGYDAGNFVRITMTFSAIRQVQAAYAFAFGEAKHPALVQLTSQAIDVVEQPAQILKELPEAYLYTDQLNEELS